MIDEIDREIFKMYDRISYKQKDNIYLSFTLISANQWIGNSL